MAHLVFERPKKRNSSPIFQPHLSWGTVESHVTSFFWVKPSMQPRQMLALPETNIAAENGWLEDEISFQDDLFSGANC